MQLYTFSRHKAKKDNMQKNDFLTHITVLLKYILQYHLMVYVKIQGIHTVQINTSNNTK